MNYPPGVSFLYSQARSCCVFVLVLLAGAMSSISGVRAQTPVFDYDPATGELRFVDDGAGVIALTFNTSDTSILPLETFESQLGSSWVFNSFENDSLFEFTDESLGSFPANGADLIIARLATGLSAADFGVVEFQISADAFIRSASVNVAPTFSLGDVNRNNSVDFLDIAPFIAILSAGDFQFEADIDGNGVVNFLDISPFIDLLNQ